ncbi:DUF262 domain-containing protein [Blastococcus sp. TML/M2B]|uniref:GmrSD restriction endonuclease domain-containing protein n=1 Tax=Blastococcus sp. TML/M2B TaxID=2798727 RepID=UPI00190CAFD7|nr:DUF262 domain-containing protein [Blastococcus sp. TML/M2B]MBN1091957.1 DUF262 domain-containing protein [Blastococcus sp. TML/M2B]
MPFKTPITIAEALEKMHRHEFVLPAIQREFVWGPERICTLFDSLMRGYPVGSLLFWHVDGDTVGSLTFYDFVQTYHQRNAPHCPVLDVEKGRSVTAVLDGQQRLTALNIGLRGSHAEKLPRLWAGNPNAYPVKKLYLDLLFVAEDNDLDQRYRFRFLTPAEAADRSGQFWFEVATIRTFKDSFDALSYAEQNSLGIASGRTLLRLYEAVHKEASLNYFEEMEQDLEKVLNIFIRVNSKAVALSSSDLLLSVATAQWRDRDAREVIHQLVDDLNETGQGFAFTKDLVLKAGLVLLGRGDIRSKVGNFDRQTMREMEDAWDDIDRALRLAALTLSTFGFSSATLQAGSVLIPVAHYLHLRGLSESYLTAAQYADDREEMRTWLMRSLIQSGVWGSGLDTLLSGLRAVLDAEARHGFPRVALEREMGRQGKSLRFDPAQIEDLLDTRYGPRAYPLLALLYPGVDVRGAFHIDHVFPKSKFTPARLRAAGYSGEVALLSEQANRLANLQLLEGAENVDKRAKLPGAWMAEAYPNADARAGYVTRNDLGDVPEEITGFADFYNQRRSRMRDRLVALLDVAGSSTGSSAAPQADDMYFDPAPRSEATRRDIGAHIVSAFAGLPEGAFLTVREIRAHRSDEYGDEFPSAGAISARLFPSSGRCTVPGVEPGENERGVRGARRITA